MSERTLIIGNSAEVLKGMDAESVDCVVTSPPYWGLRDYHSEPVEWADGWVGQLGLEDTPFQYIEHLMEIFDEVQRVLRPTGACWVNIGDTYNGTKKGNTEVRKFTKVVTDSFEKHAVEGIGLKSMLMVPERFAIAMCDRGWILRNKVVWHRLNQFPQSATDRFTNDFEMMYFFTKEPRYYFNQLKEPVKAVSIKRAEYGWKSEKANLSPGHEDGIDVERMGERFVNPEGRNMRCVWDLNTSSSQLEHCAMFPTELVARPIQATCPPGGVVLDPFCGSGTTLEYCFEHDIDCIGIDVNPAYREMIEKRMRKDQTGLTSFGLTFGEDDAS